MITLADAVEEWAKKTPTAPGWWIDIDGDLISLSWKQIEQACLLVARTLSERGLNTGDRLVSYLPNGIGWAMVDLGCALRGIIHVPVDRRLSERDLESVVEQTQGFLVRSVAEFFQTKEEGSLPDDLAIYAWSIDHFETMDFDSLRNPIHPHDPANILFTSGTTGAPLGVMLSHENLIQNARGKLDAVPQFAWDRRLNFLPFSHAYARTCELSTWALTGGSIMSVHTYDQLWTYGPRFEPTLLNAVPSVFQRLERELAHSDSTQQRKQELTQYLGSKLRCLASGGAGLPSKTFRFFHELGLPIIQGYGLTEASPVVCSNRSDHPLDDCVGPPIVQNEIRIDAEQRLYVKGPGVMLGYWNQPSATACRIQNGWLETGDRAEQLSNGSLRILGRTDDRITLSTGYKVDPAAIEQRLVGKSGIRNCMLVGSGQRFLVAIVVSDREQDHDLLQSIRKTLVDCPDYCIPRHLIIEKNDWTASSGMVNLKGSLRREAIAEHYRHKIAATYCSTLGRKQVTLDPSNRNEQGGDGTEQRNEVQQ